MARCLKSIRKKWGVFARLSLTLVFTGSLLAPLAGCKLDDNRVKGTVGGSVGENPSSPSPPVNNLDCLEAGATTNGPYANSGKSEFDGSSEAKAYLICTAAQLKALSDGSDDSLYFKLGDDIDMSFYDGSTGAKTFDPISLGTSFTGQFDGQGFKISNLKIDGVGTNYIGLFSKLTNATIKNLTLDRPIITSDSLYTGALVGGATSSSIENITAIGAGGASIDVSSTNNYVGGLIGSMTKSRLSHATSSLRVKNTTGTNTTGGLVGTTNLSAITNVETTNIQVEGGASVGGLVGSLSTSELSNSKMNGTVTGDGDRIGGAIGNASGSTITSIIVSGQVLSLSGNYIGGIIGYMGSTITLSHNSADVTAASTSSFVGGIAGELIGLSSKISQSSNVGTVSGGSSVIGGLVGNQNIFTELSFSYSGGNVSGTPGTSDQVGGAVGATTSGTITSTVSYGTTTGGTNIGGLIGGTSGSPTYTNSFYNVSANPSLNDTALGNVAGIDTRVTAAFTQAAQYTGIGWDLDGQSTNGDNEYWIVDPGLPSLRSIANPGSLSLQGAGTTSDPYLITNLTDLLSINKPEFMGYSYRLTSSIDLGSIPSWTPIGNEVFRFQGDFDGAGFSIQNLSITANTQNYLGLIGNGGLISTIKNLTIDRPHIIATDSSYVGTIAGAIGRVESCSVIGRGLASADIDVTAATINLSAIGGLVGSVNYVISSHATNIWVEIDAQGANTITGTGGIAGQAGTFNGASSTGKVVGNGDGMGGLSGQYGFVYQSFSEADVTGPLAGDASHSNAIGGLVGDNCGGILLSYSTGNIQGYREVGGLAGYTDWNNIENSYSTGDVTGDTRVGGIAGRFNGNFMHYVFTTGTVTGTTVTGAVIGYGDSTSFSGGNHRIFDSTKNGSLNPVGNQVATGFVSETTANMLLDDSYTGRGFDFEGETVNGTYDYWKSGGGGSPPLLSWQP